MALAQQSSDEDDVPLLVKLFSGRKTSSRWRGLGRISRQSSGASNASAPSVRETMQPSPSFKQRTSLRR